MVSIATDSSSGKPVAVEPSGICECTWLENDELLWHGCDGNLYLSRIAESGLAGARLLFRDVSPDFTLSGNREPVIAQAAGGAVNWWMYDLVARRRVELQGTGGMVCCWGSVLE